jgi:hypothetical protein
MALNSMDILNIIFRDLKCVTDGDGEEVVEQLKFYGFKIVDDKEEKDHE